MKILDRYILTSYLKTFFSVFIILVLIFVLQTIWLYIKELAGKDLDIVIIAKFLIYFLPKLMPLVLPLTILLASIMVFGNFAENYEFAAMKSTGISLQRAMSGLGIFIAILGVLTFFFSNNIIPWAEYNSYNLRKNIAKIKPAMAIAEGQFNPIGESGTNIKVEEKWGDNDQFLKNIIIHEKKAGGLKNTTTIIADTGELISSDSSDVLKLVLHDGNYYENLVEKKSVKEKKNPFAKSTFKTYVINIDLSEFNNVDVDDKNYTDKHNMLNINGLDYTIDSLTNKRSENHKTLSKTLYRHTNLYKLGVNKGKAVKYDKDNPQDDIEKATQQNQTFQQEVEIDKDSIYSGEILDLFNTKTKFQIVNTSFSGINSARQLATTKKAAIKPAKSLYNKHIISFHEKFALGFACIILFFIGAPLGALIRKGGLGLPMIIAILLFLTYHFIGIFAMNSAKTGSFNPILASWFSTLIMLPLSIFLTKRATQDKGLFDMDSITDPLRKMFNIKEQNSVDYKFLQSYTNDELIDVINNFEALEHKEESRYEAIKILNNRDISTKKLRENGLAINQTFENSQNINNNYNDHSKFAVTLYSIGAVLLILFFVFKNNKLPSFADASIQLSITSFALYIIYYIKSLVNVKNFYSNINKVNKKPNVIILIIGLPLYMIGYLFIKSKIKEDLKQNCLDSLK
ncbi:MAG: LptF/LptG family permease [Algibacter sp.]